MLNHPHHLYHDLRIPTTCDFKKSCHEDLVHWSDTVENVTPCVSAGLLGDACLCPHPSTNPGRENSTLFTSIFLIPHPIPEPHLLLQRYFLNVEGILTWPLAPGSSSPSHCPEGSFSPSYREGGCPWMGFKAFPAL